MYVLVLNNGRYINVMHRVVISSSRARISILTFYHPYSDVIISHVMLLTNAKHLAMFRIFTYNEYH